MLKSAFLPRKDLLRAVAGLLHNKKIILRQLNTIENLAL